MVVQHVCHGVSGCVLSYESHSMLGEVIHDNEHVHYLRLLLQLLLMITADLDLGEIQM